MKPPLPLCLTLAPRGVIVDQEGAYQGLAPWFDARLLREILRRYNEYRPLAAFAESWAHLDPEAPASAEDARQEAALAVAKARSLSALVDPPEDAAQPRQLRRRKADRFREEPPPADPGTEPFEPD